LLIDDGLRTFNIHIELGHKGLFCCSELHHFGCKWFHLLIVLHLHGLHLLFLLFTQVKGCIPVSRNAHTIAHTIALSVCLAFCTRTIVTDAGTVSSSLA